MAKKGITGAKKITVNDALKLYDSTAMIGNVHERFDILTSHPDHLRQDLDWRSFYYGWIEGRFGMYGELYTMETIRRAQELARRNMVDKVMG